MCLNNLIQLGKATHIYAAIHRGELPGFVNVVGKSSDPNNNVPGIMGTWAVALMPALERTDVYEKYFAIDPSTNSSQPGYTTGGQPTGQELPTINSFICPSDPPDDQTVDPTALSYVANCGIPDDSSYYSGTTSSGSGVTNSLPIIVIDSAAWQSGQIPRTANGVFFDRYSPRYNGIIYGTGSTSAAFPNLVSTINRIRDGNSNT